MGGQRLKQKTLTADKVTGGMVVMNREKNQNKWDHFVGIEFPGVGNYSVVDLLIGMDYNELHYAF